MAVVIVTFLASFSMMMVFAKEPENRNDLASKKHEEHLGPLVVPLVELSCDYLTAGNVDESATR